MTKFVDWKLIHAWSETKLGPEYDIPSSEEWTGTVAHSDKIKDVFRKHFGNTRSDGTNRDFFTISDFYFRAEADSLPEFYDTSQAVEDLQKIRQHLWSLGSLMANLPFAVDEDWRAQTFVRAQSLQDKDAPVGTMKSFDLDVCPEFGAYSLMNGLIMMLPFLYPALDRTIENAARGTPKGKRALDAWKVFDAAVETCELFFEEVYIPKRLGPSGPFYRFIQDLFDAEEIEEDPVNIARNWAKHVGRSKQK